MILTCPECATSFKVPDNAIGPNGRTVRCSQCNTTWFVAAEPDILALNDDFEITNEVSNDGGDYEASSQDYVEQEDKDIPSQPAFGSHNIEPDLAGASASLTNPSIAPHTLMRKRAERKKVRNRLLGVGMIWVITLSLLALIALSAYLFRAKIVEIFPGTAPIYKAFGLEANVMGLEFYDIETKYGNNEGVNVLLVNGRIKNFDRKTRPVDMIKLSFKNAAGETVASWVIEPPKPELKSGESIKFVAQYPNPPIDAVKLEQEFVKDTILPPSLGHPDRPSGNPNEIIGN